MSQAKGSPAPSRLQTGTSTTSSSTSRPNTNATTPLLPPIIEAHNYYIPPAISTSLVSGSNVVGPVEEPRPTGVRKTSTQINSRLGFFSSPDEPRSVGSHGYLSPSYSELKPAAPGTRLVTTKPHGSKVSGLRALRNGTPLLTEKDLKFLRERDTDNQQVYDVWSQRKHLELQMEREEQDRLKAESQARYEAREQQILEQNQTAVKQWEKKKVKQQQADAEDSYLKQIKLRALQAYHQRINNAYETKCKKREEGFAVRSGVAHIPHTFDAFRADRANKAAQKPLSKEKSASSYRSLLEEADREGDEEAAMIAMMGGTHPLVAIARQKSSDIAAPDGGAVFLEPSFASAARHGAATSTLPPLGRHLVSPAVLAQYLPPTTQSSKGPEGEGLVAERSGAVARHSAGFDGDDGLNDESPEDESRQGILPPNITSIYAPREVIGAIVQEERDKAQEEFQQRLKEAAEDSMRKVEVAYMPVAPSSAATVEPSESRQTATDTAALLHVSPAFFAAYGTGTGDAAVPPRPRPAAGDANNGNRSGAPHGPNQTLSASEQPENAGPGDNSDEAYSEVFGRGSEGGSGAYSRSFSGSGLGPLPAMAQSHSRRESGSSRYTSSAHSAAAAVAIPSGGVGAKKRDSGASRATSSEIAVLEPVADMASDVVPSRRESAVSQVTGGSGTPRPTDDALSDAVLSRHQSSGRQSSATRGAMAAATSGGHVSRRESAADRAADIEEDVARSAGPSRRESALSNAAEDAAGPSRRDSAASRHEPDAVLRSEGNASTSRRESPVSNGAVSGGIPSRRGSGASVGVSRAESERSRGTADAIPNLRASSVSAAVASAGPSRRDSSVSNLASEGQVPPAAARVVGSKAGTSRRGSSENMSSSACAASATAPSKRDSVGSLPVSGSEAPAMSRQESKASSYSVPPSEGVGGASSARGTASGEQGAINKLGRGSDSLGPLPLTPVAIQPNDVESKAALKAKDDEEELDVEEEESDREESEKEEEPEGDSDIEAAPPRKDEEDEEDEDEDEDEEEDGQQSGEVEARKQSAQLDSEDEGDDVRSSGDGSRTEDETEEEEEEEDVEEEDEEDAEEGDVEEGDGRK